MRTNGTSNQNVRLRTTLYNRTHSNISLSSNSSTPACSSDNTQVTSIGTTSTEEENALHGVSSSPTSAILESISIGSCSTSNPTRKSNPENYTSIEQCGETETVYGNLSINKTVPFERLYPQDITSCQEDLFVVSGGSTETSSETLLETSQKSDDICDPYKIQSHEVIVSEDEESIVFLEDHNLSNDLPFNSYQFLRDLLESTEDSLPQPPIASSYNIEVASCDNSSDSANSSVNNSNQLEVMYPVPMEQSRQDNSIPSQHTFQVHMHHLCPCSNVMYPYYPHSYRPTTMLQQAPPLARPYLQHYQYTQLQVNPTYNMPLPPPMPQHIPPGLGHSQTDMTFCPPPRDRRTFDCGDYDDKNKSINIQYNPSDPGSSHQVYDSFANLTPQQVAALSTEHYIAYLVHGCATGEKIAKRNEHRPCFKNIQNLCTRTRSEVVKPNITVSNIHSQGMPWATKDFIFAFVRAINCWCILRGYLGNKDGNLGKIDHEISPEFRACYEMWEKCTKQLTHYLIETFCKLDEANSPSHISCNIAQTQTNPSLPISTPVNKIKNSSPTRETPKKAVEAPVLTAERCAVEEVTTLKGVPGILHIPHTSASTEFVESKNQNSESTEISPRDEDSDNERRIYMKPGSYNVPTKHLSNQSNTNSPRSIEFFDTAQNVSIHQRKAAAEKSESFSSDLHWQNAQNVTPEFIKHNEESSLSTTLGKDDKYFEVTSQQNTRIEHWLNSSIFDTNTQDADEFEDTLQSPSAGRQRKSTITEEIPPWIQRKRTDVRAVSKSYSAFRRSYLWEFKGGGLTDSAVAAVERLIKELERTDFTLHIHLKLSYTHGDDCELRSPIDINKISNKLKEKKYKYLNEIVHDFRNLICSSSAFFVDPNVLKHLDSFRDKFEDMIGHAFPNVDFSSITGDPGDSIGPIVMKQRGKPRRSIDENH